MPKGERLASEVRLRGLILFALGLGRKLGVVDDKALVGAAANGAFLVVGMTVTCESELVAVEGRKLVFKVSLYDEKGPVGGGVHERFVVNDAKFAAKAESKKG